MLSQISVNTSVPSQSLLHFFAYLIIILLFVLYERHQEVDRLYNISLDQDDALIKCQQAIISQNNYIKLLEAEYINNARNTSPIH